MQLHSFRRVCRRACLFVTLAVLAMVPAFASACPAGALGTARSQSVNPAEHLALGLKTYPQTIALGDHEVVLTFDDGPVIGATSAVLDALAAECVKATFFLIGRNAQTNPGLVRREAADGHSIGHHTFSHPSLTLRGLSDAAARADIDRGIASDDRAAYGAAGRNPVWPFSGFQALVTPNRC